MRPRPAVPQLIALRYVRRRRAVPAAATPPPSKTTAPAAPIPASPHWNPACEDGPAVLIGGCAAAGEATRTGCGGAPGSSIWIADAAAGEVRAAIAAIVPMILELSGLNMGFSLAVVDAYE